MPIATGTMPYVDEAEENSVGESASCDNMGDCLSCMDSKDDCVWVNGQCAGSCKEIADSACYDKTNFPDLEVEYICSLAQDREENEDICVATSCDECTNTVMSDGSSSCTWYSTLDNISQGWCGTGGCDMTGNCGSTICVPYACHLGGVDEKVN